MEDEIRDHGILLLFWSIHAKKSQWVEWEWRKAMEHKGFERIDPHPLDPVNESEPPDELRDLQFNDRYMLIRRYYEELHE